MTNRFRTAFTTFLCLAALFVGAGAPLATAASTDSGAAAGATTTAPPADPSTTEAPVTGLTPEQIQALESGTTDPSATDGSDDRNVFQKASDFVTDHAPLFIIGIVVLAAILAGIFIMRGRGRSKVAGPDKTPVGGSDPSASELRRRKRAAMQQSREEERLRRKSHMESRRLADPNVPLPLGARLPAEENPALARTQAQAEGYVDPVEAEKQAARAPAANAVARSGGAVAPPVPTTPPGTGAIPAPAAPSQTAPAAGVVAPAAGPDTVYAPAPEDAPPAPAAPPVHSEEPTRVNPLPDYLPEPPVEAPGLDARVGEAAAAFAGGAAGGIAARGAASQEAPTAPPAPADEIDAEERLRAKVAEIRAEQGHVPAAPVAAAIPAAPAVSEEASAGPGEDPAGSAPGEAEPVPPTPSGLAGIEERLQANSELRDRTLADAEERLRRVEQQAADAEKRAAFAERLAQLKLDESERERRMNEVISGIDRAEERAHEAEERAKSAERKASEALEEPGSHAPESEPSEAPAPPAQSWQSTAPKPPRAKPPRAEPPLQPSQPPAGTGPVTPPAESPSAASVEPVKSPLFGGGLPGGTGSSGTLNLNSATFEELRDADLSVTQATRILAYRERFGGYRSLEDLEKVPGFPAELLESLRGRITV